MIEFKSCRRINLLIFFPSAAKGNQEFLSQIQIVLWAQSGRSEWRITLSLAPKTPERLGKIHKMSTHILVNFPMQFEIFRFLNTPFCSEKCRFENRFVLWNGLEGKRYYNFHKHDFKCRKNYFLESCSNIDLF